MTYIVKFKNPESKKLTMKTRKQKINKIKGDK